MAIRATHPIGNCTLKCKLHLAKYRKTCYKTYFSAFLFGSIEKKQYFCTVFFMVLDLRLSKDWVVVMTILLFFCVLFSFCLLKSEYKIDGSY